MTTLPLRPGSVRRDRPATGAGASGTTAPDPSSSSSSPLSPGEVPWPVVLVPSVVLGAATLWWVLVVRGATGYIERSQSPFTTWARESLLWLPLFALAVLLALRLARRAVGPLPSGPRAGAVVVGAMTLAAGLAGALLLGGQATYDALLERDHLRDMAGMTGGTCGPACVQRQLDAVVGLQARAFGWGLALVVATDLVLAGWLWAAAGGRVRLVGAGRPGRAATALPPTRRVLAATLVGAAVIHLAVVPEHLQEWPAAGVFFAGLAGVELLAAAGALRRLRGDLVVVVAASVVPLALWLLSRTVGLPLGPEPGATEAVGPADVVCCLLELAALGLVGVLATATPGERPASRPDLTRLAVLAVAVTTVVGLSWTGVPWLDAVGVVAAGGH